MSWLCLRQVLQLAIYRVDSARYSAIGFESGSEVVGDSRHLVRNT